MAQCIQDDGQDRGAIRHELAAGLLAARAHVSPKYLYDVLGSKLFEAICELPEYYPTRTEEAIFQEHAADIARSAGRGMTLVDLGAGNCAKAARLFPALRPERYVALDISAEFLRDAVARLQERFPRIEMTALGMDFSAALDLPEAIGLSRRLFFYPGSSIGNFSPEEAGAFLRRVRAACGPDGGILAGVDLVKDGAVLDAAYDDALGVTASFNLNLLAHVNRLLESDFNLRCWRHRGFFNPRESRVEMHLEACEDQLVRWPGGERRFARGERIHTENSYKYTRQGFITLLRESGFGETRCWTDPDGWFLVCHAHAV
ncbi:MAG: L-histidine N(alpha)-methyltransferase [Noviherbaspirillum sp.]